MDKVMRLEITLEANIISRAIAILVIRLELFTIHMLLPAVELLKNEYANIPVDM